MVTLCGDGGWGCLVPQAVRTNRWILLDEVNLAPPEVLQALMPLLNRTASTFTLPNSDVQIAVDGAKVFATMNPNSTGGGRASLPLSIRSLFATVKLTLYTNGELQHIFRSLCQPLVDTGDLTTNLISKVFEFHCNLVDQIAEKKIGRTGGPFDFNLRDLKKFQDMAVGNLKDLKESAMDAANPSVTTHAVGRFLDLVYAQSFSNDVDKADVQILIDRALEINAKDSMDVPVDATPGVQYVRIGSIYVQRGSHKPLVPVAVGDIDIHSRRYLETLGAACNSRRMVLLEGETATGKSELVRTLAKLCSHKLIVVPLTADTEVGDLVGQWLPRAQSATTGLSFQAQIQAFVAVCCRQLVLTVFPLLENGKHNTAAFLTDVERICDDAYGAADEDLYVDEALANLQRILREHIQHDIVRDVTFELEQLLVRCEYYQHESTTLAARSDELSFAFVESQLVTAIREGYWVLLDNLNCAPPEVLERLNSLFEDPPSLSMYEYSKGEVLSAAQGTISPSFRLWATVNPGRLLATRLSGALLNRVVRLHVRALDFGVLPTDVNTDHPLVRVVGARLRGLYGGHAMAHCIALFHVHMKQQVQQKALPLLEGFAYTVRSAIKAADAVATAVRRGDTDPSEGFVRALHRVYLSGLPKDQHPAALRILSAMAMDTGAFDSALLVHAIEDDATTYEDVYAELSTTVGAAVAVFELVATKCLVRGVLDQPKDAHLLCCDVVRSVLIPMMLLEADRTEARRQVHNLSANRDASQSLMEGVMKDCLVRSFPTIDLHAFTSEVVDVASELPRSLLTVQHALQRFVQRTSFTDADDRRDACHRVFRVVLRVLAIFERHRAADTTMALREWSILEAALDRFFDDVCDARLHEAWDAVASDAAKVGVHALTWQVGQCMVQPINTFPSGGLRKLSRLIYDVQTRTEATGHTTVLLRYAWAIASWSFKLTLPWQSLALAHRATSTQLVSLQWMLLEARYLNLDLQKQLWPYSERLQVVSDTLGDLTDPHRAKQREKAQAKLDHEDTKEKELLRKLSERMQTIMELFQRFEIVDTLQNSKQETSGTEDAGDEIARETIIGKTLQSMFAMFSTLGTPAAVPAAQDGEMLAEKGSADEDDDDDLLQSPARSQSPPSALDPPLRTTGGNELDVLYTDTETILVATEEEMRTLLQSSTAVTRNEIAQVEADVLKVRQRASEVHAAVAVHRQMRKDRHQQLQDQQRQREADLRGVQTQAGELERALSTEVLHDATHPAMCASRDLLALGAKHTTRIMEQLRACVSTQANMERTLDVLCAQAPDALKLYLAWGVDAIFSAVWMLLRLAPECAVTVPVVVTVTDVAPLLEAFCRRHAHNETLVVYHVHQAAAFAVQLSFVVCQRTASGIDVICGGQNELVATCQATLAQHTTVRGSVRRVEAPRMRAVDPIEQVVHHVASICELVNDEAMEPTCVREALESARKAVCKYTHTVEDNTDTYNGCGFLLALQRSINDFAQQLPVKLRPDCFVKGRLVVEQSRLHDDIGLMIPRDDVSRERLAQFIANNQLEAVANVAAMALDALNALLVAGNDARELRTRVSATLTEALRCVDFVKELFFRVPQGSAADIAVSELFAPTPLNKLVATVTAVAEMGHIRGFTERLAEVTMHFLS